MSNYQPFRAVKSAGNFLQGLRRPAADKPAAGEKPADKPATGGEPAAGEKPISGEEPAAGEETASGENPTTGKKSSSRKKRGAGKKRSRRKKKKASAAESSGKTRKKPDIITKFVTLAFLVGVFLILYPIVSQWYNSYHESIAVMGYAENVSGMDPAKLEQIWNDATEYNKKITEIGNQWDVDDAWMETYMKQLAIDDTGIMGYIRIAKIDVTLPIYHTTEEKVLQSGVGHMPGTSLPVGGKGTHTVVSGHRGVPTARLLTDLDKVEIGDTFQLNILNRTLNYEVDQIRIVEPTDFSNLQIDENMDLCTVFTCTPYGINSHRLLVRGHRIKGGTGNIAVPSDAMQYKTYLMVPFFGAPLLLIVLLALLIENELQRRAKIRRREAWHEMLHTEEDPPDTRDEIDLPDLTDMIH